MTDPIQPTPVAPADPPSPSPAQLASRLTPPDPEPTPFDPSSLSPEVQAYLRAQVDAADRKARVTSKQNAAEEARQALLAEFAEKLGLTETADPDELLAQAAAERDQYREQYEAVVFRNSVESTVRAAAGTGADGLLDSVSFLDSLDDLVDEDPASPEFKAAVQAKVQEALAKKAAGQAPAPGAPRPDPSQGSRGPARPGFSGSLSDAIRHEMVGKI